MGDSFHSALYGMGGFLIIYLVGVGIYEITCLIKRWKYRSEGWDNSKEC